MAVDSWNEFFFGNKFTRLYVSSSTANVKPEYIAGYMETVKDKEGDH
jgi:hypothetical protein